MPITKPFRVVLTLALLLSGGVLVNSTYAGPEAISAKDKNPIVEVPTSCDPKWYVSVGAGTEFDGGNDFSNGFEEFNDFGIITTDLHVKSRDYDDVYKNWVNINAEVGYALTNHLEIFGKFNYTQADSQFITGSSLVIDSPINPFSPLAIGLPFTSKFSNYESWGGELGLRFFFLGKQSRIRPYISLSGGVNFVDDIDLHVKSDFLNIDFTVYEGDFYDATTMATGTALFGLEFQVIPCRFSITVDAGVRYNSGLDGDDSDFSSSSSSNSNMATFLHENIGTNGSSEGLQQALLSSLSHLNNNGGERWSIPVNVAAKFRF